MPSHFLDQWWPRNWRKYASLGVNGLKHGWTFSNGCHDLFTYKCWVHYKTNIRRLYWFKWSYGLDSGLPRSHFFILHFIFVLNFTNRYIGAIKKWKSLVNFHNDIVFIDTRAILWYLDIISIELPTIVNVVMQLHKRVRNNVWFDE